MRKFFIFVIVYLSAVQIIAADKVGNSGSVWTCKSNDKQSVSEILFVDLFEAETTGLFIVPEEIDPMLKFDQIQTWFAQNMKMGLEYYFDHVRNNIRFVPAEMMNLSDTQPFLKPLATSCGGQSWDFEQLVIFRPNGAIFIRQDYWNSPHFSNTEKAAVLVHEAIYFYTRTKLGDEKSDRARAITGYLFSDERIAIKKQKIRWLLSLPPSSTIPTVPVDPSPYCQSEDWVDSPEQLKELLISSNDHSVKHVTLYANTDERSKYNLRENRYVFSIGSATLNLGESSDGHLTTYPFQTRGSFIPLKVSQEKSDEIFKNLTFENLDSWNLTNFLGVPVHYYSIFSGLDFGIFSNVNPLSDSQLSPTQMEPGSTHLLFVKSIFGLQQSEFQLYKIQIETPPNQESASLKYALLAEIPLEVMKKYTCKKRDQILSSAGVGVRNIYFSNWNYYTGNFNFVTGTSGEANYLAGVYPQMYIRCDTKNGSCSGELEQKYLDVNLSMGIVDLNETSIHAVTPENWKEYFNSAATKVLMPGAPSLQKAELRIGHTYLISTIEQQNYITPGQKVVALIRVIDLDFMYLRVEWKRLVGELKLSH